MLDCVLATVSHGSLVACLTFVVLSFCGATVCTHIHVVSCDRHVASHNLGGF